MPSKNCCSHLKRRLEFAGKLSLMLLCATSAGAVQSQEREEVVVNATRVTKDAFKIPAAIGVVNKEQIQLMRQQLGLDESLARIPGIFMQNRYNFAQDLRIAIRGSGARGSFGVRGVKILVDGIPNTMPDGQGQLDSVDIGSIDRIDVLRGASSSLYGNASGGVINITSESGTVKPYLELRSAFGEYGYGKSQIKTAGKSGRVDYLLSASLLELDGYRDHSEARNRNFNSRFKIQLDETSDLVAVVNLFDSPVSDDPGGINAESVAIDPSQARDRNVQFDAGEEIEQQKFGLRYRKFLGEQQELLVRAYRLERDFANKLPFVDGGIVQFDRTFTGGGVQYINTAPIAKLGNRLTVGIDLDYQEDDRRRFNNHNGTLGALVFDQLEEVTSMGLFVQDELVLSDRLELTLGLRYDELEFDVDDRFLSNGDDSGSRDLDSWSGSVGVVWQLADQFYLYGSIGSSFETPTTTELANPVGGGFNQDLDPQQAVNYELGFKGLTHDNNFSFDLALFWMDIDDELTPFELAHSPGRTFYENAGQSTRRGLELAAQWQIIEGLDWSLGYTYSDFEFERFNNGNGERFDGNAIPGIPEHLAYVSLNYTNGSFFAASDLQFVDGFYANNTNSVESDDYWVGNIRIGCKLHFERVELTPFVGINNLFDEQYAANVRINAFGGRYFEPAPERNLYGGLMVRFDY